MSNNEVQLNFGKSLVDMLPIYTVTLSKGELALTVPVSSIVPTLKFLRDHTNCQFKVLIKWLNKADLSVLSTVTNHCSILGLLALSAPMVISTGL